MTAKDGTGDLGFEQKLWAAADKLRSNMDAAEYKHVVLGLIFLKYISDTFEELHKELENDKDSDSEEVDEYTARRVFWVPKNARWDYLEKNAKKPEIGELIDHAMDEIEKDNPSLKGVLPKNYARPALNKQRLGELMDLIGTIGLGDKIRLNFNARALYNGKYYSYQNILYENVRLLANYIMGKSSKLQFNVPEFKIKREDSTDVRSKVLSLTPEDRKRLGINKSTLWYMQKHIKEGKRIKVYGKVMGKIK